MSLILGLNAYHPDSSACLLSDGKLVAAVADERLGERLKHRAGFPSHAIASVLKAAGASLRDVEFVAMGRDANANTQAKIGHVLRNPLKSARGVVTHLQRRGTLRSLQEQVAEACGSSAGDCHFKTVMVEHHLAHVASSFYASPFERAAAFTYDGSGDFVSGMYARCEGTKIDVLNRVFVPHSLGFFYTAICQFIGFDRFGEEYKVMGLSAYGKPVYLDLMKKLVQLRNDGQFTLDQNYFKTMGKSIDECVNEQGEIQLPYLYTSELLKALGIPRVRGAELTQRDKDLASSCQEHFEGIVLDCLRWLHTKMPVDALVTAGGCALNGVCNARILRDTPFTKSYIQCAASDDGTAIGAALYTWHSTLGKPRGEAIYDAYLGPEHSEASMEQALLRDGFKFERLERDALLARAAQHLNNGHIIGWYQGKSEWGPRALGNRSILAHPGWPGMKDLINQKIKRRESFRPFAPSILADEVVNYFEQDIESPFMMHVVKIKPEKRKALAAVCHEDGTGRLQTVKRDQNSLYYDLIRKFSTLSGIPVVLNTSFNENEPIVDTPEQAVACYKRNDIDALFLGPFVTVKPGKQLS